jgi:hypothetical protein
MMLKTGTQMTQITQIFADIYHLSDNLQNWIEKQN